MAALWTEPFARVLPECCSSAARALARCRPGGTRGASNSSTTYLLRLRLRDPKQYASHGEPHRGAAVFNRFAHSAGPGLMVEGGLLLAGSLGSSLLG